MNASRSYGFVLLAGFALMSGAQAATFCVSNGNQLNSALNTAALNLEDDVIKIEYGTLTSNYYAPQTYQWQFTPAAGENSEYSLAISGGWSKGNNCLNVVSQNPNQTVLDAQYAGPVFVADLRWQFGGTFSIKNLTFTRGRAFPNCMVNNGEINGCPVAGVHVEAWASIGAQVIVDNVMVTAGTSEPSTHASIARFYMKDGGFLRLRNSIFFGNQLNGAGGNSNGVTLQTANNSIMFVSNNSIYNNAVRTRESGMVAEGTGTFSNNAIAGNTTSHADNYQFFSPNAAALSLHHNHFETRHYLLPAEEIGTTIGAPGWSLQGMRMVPNADSQLRDSGDNTPAGSALSIDFSGGARIIGGTIDRGAVEAAAIPPTGPMLSASTPSSGSTTTLPPSNVAIELRYIQFAVSGGTSGGSTQLTCAVTAGSAQILSNASQVIATGGSAAAISVSLPVSSTPVTHTISCSAVRLNAATQNFFFHYFTASATLMANGFE